MTKRVWLILVLVLVLTLAVPASAIYEAPICQGTHQGYIGVWVPAQEQAVYFYLFKQQGDLETGNVLCFIPGDAKLSITFPQRIGLKEHL